MTARIRLRDVLDLGERPANCTTCGANVIQPINVAGFPVCGVCVGRVAILSAPAWAWVLLEAVAELAHEGAKAKARAAETKIRDRRPS